MATPSDVSALIDHLQHSKVLDLNAVTATLPQTIGRVSAGEEAGWYVLGGDHYVVVCGLTDRAALSVNPALEKVRGEIGR